MALAISPEFLVFVVVLMIASRVFRFRSFAMHMLSGLKYWAAAPKDNMEEIVLLQRKVLFGEEAVPDKPSSSSGKKGKKSKKQPKKPPAAPTAIAGPRERQEVGRVLDRLTDYWTATTQAGVFAAPGSTEASVATLSHNIQRTTQWDRMYLFQVLQLFVNLLTGAAAVTAFAELWAWVRDGERGDFSAVVLAVVAFASLVSQGLPYSIAGVFNTEALLALGYGLLGLLLALGAVSLPDRVADFRLVQAVVEAKGRAELMVLRTAVALGTSGGVGGGGGGAPAQGWGSGDGAGEEGEAVDETGAADADAGAGEGEGSLAGNNQTEVLAEGGASEEGGLFGDLDGDWDEEEEQGMNGGAGDWAGAEGGLDIVPGAAVGEDGGIDGGTGDGALSDMAAAAGVRLFAAFVAAMVAVLLFRPAVWSARTYFAATRGPDKEALPQWRRVCLMVLFFVPLFLALSWIKPVIGDLVLAPDLVKCDAQSLARDCTALQRPPAPEYASFADAAVGWLSPWTWDRSRIYLTESQWLALRVWAAIAWGTAHLLTVRVHAMHHLILARREIRDSLWVTAAAPRPPSFDRVYNACNLASVRQRLTLAVLALQHVAAGALVLALGLMLARHGRVPLMPAGWADGLVLGACRWVDGLGVLGDTRLCSVSEGADGSGDAASPLWGQDGMGWRGPLRGFGEVPEGGKQSFLMDAMDWARGVPAYMLGLEEEEGKDAAVDKGAVDGQEQGQELGKDEGGLMSPLVLRSALSFLLWWVCTAWFFASLLGLFYWEIRRVTTEVQGEEATEGGAGMQEQKQDKDYDKEEGEEEGKRAAEEAAPGKKGKGGKASGKGKRGKAKAGSRSH